ncbi:outer membrane beta-barrel protein [Halioxenophilus aromaticivorans]|uniref:TIGR03016 family PEP-CTERM system-associated outer membrane protein n=1 Tax=Halioxenophilus aromaticivorans TaxID=1306992 RepID=A0AAV3U1X5_9ALTE
MSASLALLPLHSLAELAVDVGHNSEISDNAYLVEDNTTDKTEHRSWIEAAVDVEKQNWQLDAGYRYTNVEVGVDFGFYPEQSELAGATHFYGTALRQRVALDANHDRRVMYVQPGARDLPTNQQIRDTASVTPILYLQNNSRQQIYLSGLYTQVSYDSLSDGPTTAIDNETTGVALTAERELSGVDTAGLRIEQVTASYDEDTFEDNTYSSLVGFYSAELRRLSYSASLGVNRVETDGLDTLTAPTASLGLNYTAGDTVLGFFSQYFITDSSRGNLAGSQFNLDTDASEIGSGDARSVDRYTLISNRFSIEHTFNDRTFAAARFEIADENYEERPALDQTNLSLLAEVGHRFNNRLDASLNMRLRQANFDRIGALENTTTAYNAIANYFATERLQVRLELTYRERDSDAEGFSFTEQAATLGFSYRLRP